VAHDLGTVRKSLRALPVNEITVEHVLAVLGPIWKTVPETASRVRGRIERVLNAAKVAGYRSGENPATWRGHLENLLPQRQKLSRGHHRALPWAEVPAFVATLRERTSVAALALEFTILTAARSGEVRGATWDEADFERGIWTVSAARMKAAREHRVPLVLWRFGQSSAMPNRQKKFNLYEITPNLRRSISLTFNLCCNVGKIDKEKTREAASFLSSKMGPFVLHNLKIVIITPFLEHKSITKKQVSKLCAKFKNSSMDLSSTIDDFLEIGVQISPLREPDFVVDHV
jgi:hypothetical protein